MAILDGEFVDDKDIDPARHKFIGTFREPFSTYESVSLVFFHCGCGENLFNQQAVFDHWQRGHMGAPQYVTIGEDRKESKYEMNYGLVLLDNKFVRNSDIDPKRHRFIGVKKMPLGTGFNDVEQYVTVDGSVKVKMHKCIFDPAMPHNQYGSATDECFEDENGEFWVTNGEYTNQVNYCPMCGKKAPRQVGE